jgi:hypothetical protein
MYTISEILEYQTDDFGNLHCVFKLEGDEKGTVRVLSTASYYDWVSQLEEYTKYYINLNEDEDEYNFDNDFNFELWREENETEEIVKDFIYQNYETIDDLPEIEDNPLA